MTDSEANTMTETDFTIDDDLLPDPLVAKRYKVTSRTISRWDTDPKLGFPKPIEINGRKYRRKTELEEFERAHVAA